MVLLLPLDEVHSLWRDWALRWAGVRVVEEEEGRGGGSGREVGVVEAGLLRIVLK